MDSNLSLSRRTRLLRRWKESGGDIRQSLVPFSAHNHHRSCKAVVAAFTAIVVANLSCFSQAFTPPAASSEQIRAASSEKGWGNDKAWMTSSAHQCSFAERGRAPSWKISSCVPLPQHARRLSCRRLVLYITYLSSSSIKLAASERPSTRLLMASAPSSPGASSPSTVRQVAQNLDTCDDAWDSSGGRTPRDARSRPDQTAPTSPRAPAKTVFLTPCDPMEFWHNKGLVLGNYEGPIPGRKSLSVRTEFGEPLVIDAGQIVGVWLEDEMRVGPLPGDTASWERVRAEVTALLQGVPGRGLDLEPFWRAAVAKGKGFVATPAHAAEFLFGGGGRAAGLSRGGLRKKPPFQFSTSPCEAYLPTVVERAAAVQVLAGELNRFKRVVSQRLDDKHGPPPQSNNSGKNKAGAASKCGRDAEEILTNQGERDVVVLQLGGFKALDQSVAATREVADFCRVVESIKAATLAEEALPIRGREGGASDGKRGRRGAADKGGGRGKGAKEGLFEPSFLLILHSLEAFAIGGDERSLTPEGRRVMEFMGKSGSSAAKEILVDVGLWTRSNFSSEGGDASLGGKRAVKGQGPDDIEVESGVEDRSAVEVEVEVEDGIGVVVEGDEDGGGVIPWSKKALEDATALMAERARRTSNYDRKAPRGRAGSPAPFGRHDFRNISHGVYCIDGTGTSFLDDAFSIDPETREVFVHITDVQGLVSPGSILDELARLRAASEYLPQGPLFMMPPTALKAMSFSDRAVNEAITVGFRLDPEAGTIVSSRVMLTLLPPVVPLTFGQADRILEARERGDEVTGRLARVAAEIRALEYVSRRSAEAAGRRERGGREGVRLRVGGGGKVQATEVPQQSRALSLVDELLTVYTLEVYGLCRKAGVAMPSLVGQQDRVAAGRSRYGTGPLRRYVDILAQRQIAAVLRGSGYLAKEHLLETASYLTWRHNKTRALRQLEAGRLSLESLAAHCRSQVKATGLPHAVMPARGTGRGREVRLEGIGVCVHAKRAPGSGRRRVSIDRDQRVRVVIKKVDPGLKQVVAIECLDDDRAV